jgi:predicted DCC family thiol-disulfide oxidoreductase YuxK
VNVLTAQAQRIAPGASPASPLEHPIIFFDGVCAMCNRFVDLILRADRREVFRLA